MKKLIFKLMFSLLILTGVVIPLAVAEVDSSIIENGSKVYEKWCAACHSDGHQFAGTVALQAKYKGSIPAVLIQRTDMTPEFITYFVRNGYSVMPFFRKTEINDAELNALGAFLTEKSNHRANIKNY